MNNATRIFFGQARMKADRTWGHRHSAPRLSMIGVSLHGESAIYHSHCKHCAHNITVYEYEDGQISGNNPEYTCAG